MFRTLKCLEPFLVRANDPLIYIGDRRSPPYIYIYIGGVGALVESELGRTRPARGGGGPRPARGGGGQIRRRPPPGAGETPREGRQLRLSERT